MNQQAITHKCDCSQCGRANELYRQADFRQLCLTLLSGDTGEVLCGCGRTEKIVWRDGQLQQFIGLEATSTMEKSA